MYTGFLCDAITYRPLIRKGGKSLEDIINFIYFLSKKWSESHKCEQHPVFRSSLSGTIYFTVEEYHPYYTEKFYTRYFDNQNIRAKAESVDEKHLYGLYYDYDSSFEHGLWGRYENWLCLSVIIQRISIITFPMSMMKIF